MAKIDIEIGKDWICLETIPITPKTDSEILNRIPETKLWRAAYLSHIIKSPKMSLWEWGDIPFNTISIIYDCIQDFLGEYETEIELLNTTIDQINSNKYEGDTLKKLIKQRDFLIKSIEDKEENKKHLKYSKKNIDIIHRSSEIKKPSKIRPSQEIIYFM